MRIEYFSKREAEPKDNIALISIRDKEKSTNLLSGWKNLLALQFDDIDPEEVKSAFPCDFERMMKDYITMSDVDVMAIKQFVENLPKSIDSIYIHCHAGRSRSATIAKFVSEKIGAELKKSRDINLNNFIYNALKRLW